MKKLPIGKSDFESIISENFIYIDKTEYIYNLINEAGFYFLSRPRRFGKSLLISALENLFKANKELFKGLFVYDKIDWKNYPVIKISFLTICYDTPELLKESLLKFINKTAEYHKVKIDSIHYKDAFIELIQNLSQKEKVVILVDEYDKPLIDYLENIEQCNQNREILKSFYAAIKGCEEYIKFVFITGVSKFSQTSIFSDLNNLDDITLKYKYNGICGYKKKDIEKYFKEYLDEFSEKKNKPIKDMLDEIKHWYDGYSWNGSEFLYNPFSVLNLFSNQIFKNYWFKSGTPTFLLKLIRNNNYNLSDIAKLTVADDIFDKYNIEKISVIALLFQTGYLTIKNVEETSGGVLYTLDFPNYEVKKSLMEHLISEYCGETNGAKSTLLYKLKQNLMNKEFDEFIDSLKSLFAGLVYETHINREDYYSSLMYMVFSLCGIDGGFELLTNKGRIDCVVEFRNLIYIIEFKVDINAEAAIRQIYEKKYYEKYLNKNKEIYLFGLSFDTKDKNILDTKIEKFYIEKRVAFFSTF